MIIYLIIGIVIATAFNTYRAYINKKIEDLNNKLITITENRDFYQNAMNEILKEKQKLFNEFIECKAKANLFDDIKK